MALARYADIVSRLSILGVDKSVRDLTRFQTGLTTLATRSRMIAKPMLAIGAAAAVGVGIFTKQAATFETALVDMGKVTSESVDSIRKKMMGLAPELGSAVEAVKGYYQVISAGVKDPTKSLGTLTVAAKAAKAAHVEQSEVIKGLTKMMEGYEGKIKSVSEAADLLFTIEKEGQTTVAELIPVVGGLAKMSYDLGVSQDEMGASLATVTKTAGNTAEAATQYRMTLMALMKPSETMEEALKSMGYANAEAAIKVLGFVGTLKGLKEWCGKTGNSMAEMMGRQRALIGMSALSAKNFGTLTDTIKEMENKVGAADKAFQDWKKTLDALWLTFKSTLGRAMIAMGTEFLPVVGDMIKRLTKLIDKFNNLDKSTKRVIARVTILTAGIGLLGGASILLAGQLALAIKALSTTSLAMGGLAAATNPVFLAVAAVTASVLALIGVLYKYSKYAEENRALSEKIADITTEQAVKFDRLVATYKRLRDKVDKTKAETVLYKDVIEELNSKYPDYLRNIDLEKDGYEKVAGAIDLAREALLKKVKAEATMKVVKEYREKLVEAEKKLVKLTAERYRALGYIEEHPKRHAAALNKVVYVDRQIVEAEKRKVRLMELLNDLLESQPDLLDKIKEKHREVADELVKVQGEYKKITDEAKRSAEQQRRAFDELFDYRRALGLVEIDEEIKHIERRLRAGDLAANEEAALIRELYDLKAMKIEESVKLERESAEKEVASIKSTLENKRVSFRESMMFRRREAKLAALLAEDEEAIIKRRKEALAKEYEAELRIVKARKGPVREEIERAKIARRWRARTEPTPGAPERIIRPVKPERPEIHVYAPITQDPTKTGRQLADSLAPTLEKASKRIREQETIELYKVIDRGGFH